MAQKVAAAEGVSLATTLLTGRASDEIWSYAEKSRPWLLLLGRIGVHSREEMDIGSVTEHLLRFSRCNLLIASRRFSPPLEIWGDVSLQWTREAEDALKGPPEQYRGVLRLMVQSLAQERGHTVVTTELAREAMKLLRPRREETQLMEEAAVSVARQALGKEPGVVYLCPRCGRAARSEKPVACPACGQDGRAFLEVPTDLLLAAADAEGGAEEERAFDGASVRWSRAATEALRAIEGAHERRRARLRIEKAARLARIPVITLEFAERHLLVGRRSDG